MKHIPMGWLLTAAVLFGFTMPGTAAHTTEKEANMKIRTFSGGMKR